MMGTPYPVFLKGEIFRDRQGNTWTVLDQIGNRVYVYENPLVWFHPDKLIRVDTSKYDKIYADSNSVAPTRDQFRNMRGRPGGKV